MKIPYKVPHLDSQIEEQLNAQIQREHQASMVYLFMAIWAEINHYPKTAAFFHQQSSEEREHMMKIMRYLIDLERTPSVPIIQEVPRHYEDLPAMLRQFLAQEQSVTRAIHHIVETALEKKDYPTFQFLQWFVAEQQEEEALARKAIDLAHVLSPDGFRRHATDQAIAELRNTVDNT